MRINLTNLHDAAPKKTWWQKYRVSVFIGVVFSLIPLPPKYLNPVEMGVLFVLLCVGYIVWLCSRRSTPSR